MKHVYEIHKLHSTFVMNEVASNIVYSYNLVISVVKSVAFFVWNISKIIKELFSADFKRRGCKDACHPVKDVILNSCNYIRV